MTDPMGRSALPRHTRYKSPMTGAKPYDALALKARTKFSPHRKKAQRPSHSGCARGGRASGSAATSTPASRKKHGNISLRAEPPAACNSGDMQRSRAAAAAAQTFLEIHMQMAKEYRQHSANRTPEVQRAAA